MFWRWSTQALTITFFLFKFSMFNTSDAFFYIKSVSQMFCPRDLFRELKRVRDHAFLRLEDDITYCTQSVDVEVFYTDTYLGHSVLGAS